MRPLFNNLKGYVIGKENPVSLRVDTFGTSNISDFEIEVMLEDNFDLSLYGIIEYLQLWAPVYRHVASYGHFGRNDLRLSWEQIKELK